MFGQKYVPEIFPWMYGDRCVGLTPLQPFCAAVLKSKGPGIKCFCNFLSA